MKLNYGQFIAYVIKSGLAKRSFQVVELLAEKFFLKNMPCRLVDTT